MCVYFLFGKLQPRNLALPKNEERNVSQGIIDYYSICHHQGYSIINIDRDSEAEDIPKCPHLGSPYFSLRFPLPPLLRPSVTEPPASSRRCSSCQPTVSKRPGPCPRHFSCRSSCRPRASRSRCPCPSDLPCCVTLSMSMYMNSFLHDEHGVLISLDSESNVSVVTLGIQTRWGRRTYLERLPTYVWSLVLR